MNHRAKQHWLKEFLNKYPQAFAYLGLGLVLVLIFVLDGRNETADERQLCISGVDSRNVDRDQTQRIYSLAIGSIPKDSKNLPPEQQKQLKNYIARVESFRKESFETIKPSEFCKDYVEDDLVTPQEWEKAHPPNQLDDEEPGDKQ